MLPLVTGALDLIDGIRLLKTAGFPSIDEIDRDPALNSQIKFWGAIWLGYGIILWRTSSRLRHDANLFRIPCAILFVSGLGRLGASVRYGLPGTVLTAAMGLELTAPIVALLAHKAGLDSQSRMIPYSLRKRVAGLS